MPASRPSNDARTPPESPAEFGRWSFWRRWLGRKSERVAAKHLRRLGYRILAANLADLRGEIDLLALDGGTIVVVEVRSTSQADPQVAADSVNYPKQKRLTEAALRFLTRRRLLGVNVRFDVLAVAWGNGGAEPAMLHLRGAFEATGTFQMFS